MTAQFFFALVVSCVVVFFFFCQFAVTHRQSAHRADQRIVHSSFHIFALICVCLVAWVCVAARHGMCGSGCSVSRMIPNMLYPQEVRVVGGS